MQARVSPSLGLEQMVLFCFFFTTNMVDDVVDSMERKNLTSKEEEIIAISDEEWLEAIESCNLSLIGKS